MVDKLINNPFAVLLVAGFLLLIVSIIVMMARNNYTRIIKMIDEDEEQAINRRIEEWGEMIVNNVQQRCMERKLALTLYVFLLPVLALILIAFSIYKLDMLISLLIVIVHLIVVLVIYYIIRLISRRKNVKKPTNNTKVEESEKD